MSESETVYTYLRLCVRAHKRIYVQISVMLSCVTEHLFGWYFQMWLAT